MRERLPPDLYQYLPNESLSVQHFLDIKLPSYLETTPFLQPQKYLSGLEPTTTKADEILCLPSPPESTVKILTKLIHDEAVKSIECPHSASVTRGCRYPVWIVLIWQELFHIRRDQKRWQHAVTNFETGRSLEAGHKIFNAVKTALLYTPWTGQLQGFTNTIDLQQLSAYLTHEWLTDEYELLMLDVLKSDLLANNCTNIFIEDPAFATLLEVAYENQEDYTTSKGYQWIHTRGEELASGQKQYLATIVNQHDMHWTAVVIDFEQHEILYGDLFQNAMDSNLCSILDWWVQEHSGQLFAHRLLPITRPQDNFSCGMLAWDAIHCYLLPSPCRPLMDHRYPRIERAKMFLELTKFYRPIRRILFQTTRIWNCQQPPTTQASQPNHCHTFPVNIMLLKHHKATRKRHTQVLQYTMHSMEASVKDCFAISERLHIKSMKIIFIE